MKSKANKQNCIKATPYWDFESLYCKLCRKPINPFTMSEHKGICNDCLTQPKNVYICMPKEKINENKGD